MYAALLFSVNIRTRCTPLVNNTPQYIDFIAFQAICQAKVATLVNILSIPKISQAIIHKFGCGDKKTALPKQDRMETVSAAETANLAENLPDGAAVSIAVGIAREEEHLADLLIRICLAKTRWILPHWERFFKL